MLGKEIGSIDYMIISRSDDWYRSPCHSLSPILPTPGTDQFPSRAARRRQSGHSVQALARIAIG